MTKETSLFKSYKVKHKANAHKLNALFELYNVYQKQYKSFMHNHWYYFLHHQYHLISTSYYNYNPNNPNKLSIPNYYKAFSFTHLGSTKHIDTPLNASYLQCCLQQVASSLNKHLTSIEKLFSYIILQSSIHTNNINNSNLENKDFLHQLRSINKNRAWLNKNTTYYPIITQTIVDDFGNQITLSSKKETFVSQQALTLAKQIFKHIVKNRIQFPSTHHPKLVIDDRTCEIQSNDDSKSFDYWLSISTLQKNKKVLIPILSHDYFENALGIKGKTVELNFTSFDYKVKQHKHDSLHHQKKHNKFVYSNKQLNITFNKKYTLNQQQTKLNVYNNNDFNQLNNKTDVVGFDLGLSTLIATSDGDCYGKNWLDKLTQYDVKITELSRARQQLGLKTRSKRYDRLIQQVRGFIKSEINRILNHYFEVHHQRLQKIVIEKLYFNNPQLSKKLNRIIKNFGQTLFKDKLNELGLIYHVSIEEINSAYTSQQCSSCGYIDEKNRKTQKLFTCLCCGVKEHADYNASKTILGRSSESMKVLLSKVISRKQVLEKLKEQFLNNAQTLLFNRKISRRNVYNVLSKNKYFTKENINFVITTEEQGVAPALMK